MPALPPVPQVIKAAIQGNIAGSPFTWHMFLRYSGSPPGNADMLSLGHYINGQVATELISYQANDVQYQTCTCTDLSSPTGATNVAGDTAMGVQSSPASAALMAVKIKFRINRRYRGGHPGIYFPPMGSGHIQDPENWTAADINNLTTAFATFAGRISGGTYGGATINSHVVVSYYQGYHNVTYPNGRVASVPTLRSAPLVDPVAGYVAETLISTQRRRGAR